MLNTVTRVLLLVLVVFASAAIARATDSRKPARDFQNDDPTPASEHLNCGHGGCGRLPARWM